ncbi:MAG: hypothetical protein WCY77_01310 [Weeksellaceae bacterium]|nr:hypothetical protein [Flavobacterium sp.]
MKKYVLTTVCALFLFSCGKDNPVSQKVKELKETKDAVSNMSKSAREIQNMQGDMEKLKEIEPLTNDELKAWLPDDVLGMSRKSFKAGETGFINVSSISASYSNEDKSKTFSITVYDGAGEMGALVTAGFRMMIAQDFEEEDENGFKRTSKKDGKKIIEQFKNGNSEIQLMEGDRFFLEAKGKGMDIDETWKAIEALKLNKLG